MWRAGKRMKKEIEAAGGVLGRAGHAERSGRLRLHAADDHARGHGNRAADEHAALPGGGARHHRGAVAGTLVAAFIAWLWSRYGHRVNLARFFQVTAVFLLVFVVQLFIYGFHELTEANIIAPLGAWHDATEPFGPDGVYGQYLTYMLVVLPVGWLALSSLLGPRARPQPQRSQAAWNRTIARPEPSTGRLNGPAPYNRRMAESTPPSLRPLSSWSGNTISCLAAGRAIAMTLDSASQAGPSPMQALGFALAGCMAMDVVHVLQKGRHDLRGLRVDLKSARAPPRTAPLHRDRAALHDHRQRSSGTDRASHPAFPRKLLFRLALDAPGHRARRHVHRVGRAVTSERDGRASVRRASYLDWLRGVAVLLMIDAHLSTAGRGSPIVRRAFGIAMILAAWARRCFCSSRACACALGGIEAAGPETSGGAAAPSPAAASKSSRSLSCSGCRLDPRGWSAWHAAEGRHPQHHGTVDRRCRAPVAPASSARGGCHLRDRHRRDRS